MSTALGKIALWFNSKQLYFIARLIDDIAWFFDALDEDYYK